MLDLEATGAEEVSCSIQDAAATRVLRFSAGTRRIVLLEVPWQPGSRTRFRLAAPQVRVYRCTWSGSAEEPESNALHFRCEGVMAESNQDIAPRIQQHVPASAVATRRTEPIGAVHLHTNACGDFTLMAREHWFDLRGYPEFDMYSFHIDSILCYAAHHGGASEEILKEPMRIYHIEHGMGSGWTPEGQARLFDRLRAKGISWIEYQELVVWAAQMRKLNSPFIFNRENWGLGDFELPEMLP